MDRRGARRAPACSRLLAAQAAGLSLLCLLAPLGRPFSSGPERAPWARSVLAGGDSGLGRFLQPGEARLRPWEARWHAQGPHDATPAGDLPLTLVVNLDRSPERWERCNEEFVKEGITIERFSATDGKALSQEELIQNCTRSARLLCTKGMLGCFLSHRGIWNKVASEELPAVIVLEDDVRLYPRFADKVRGLMAELPSDWDVLLLGAVACVNPDVEPWFLKLYGFMTGGWRPAPGKTRRISPQICVPFRPAGTHAYMISQKGAQKLLKELPRAQYHVDLSAWALPDLRLYAAADFVATQSFDTDSTVSQAGEPLTRRFMRWCWSILRISKMAKMCGIENIQWVWKVAIFALPVPFRKTRVAVDLGPSSSIWVMLVVAAVVFRSTKLMAAAVLYQGILISLCRYLCGTWNTIFSSVFCLVAGALLLV